MANYAPDDYWAFSTALFAKEPAANSAGLTDSQILDVIGSAGVHNLTKVSNCVKSEKFKLWVSAATTRALSGPLPDSTTKKVQGNLTVIVDGQAYPVTAADVKSAAAFAAFVEHRRIVEIEPDLLGLSGAVQRQYLFAIGKRAAFA